MAEVGHAKEAVGQLVVAVAFDATLERLAQLLDMGQSQRSVGKKR